jgi:hypothetical protein
MNRIAIVLKSKTFWGSVLTACSWLVAQPHVGTIDILQALGGVVTAVGVRDAIGQVQTGETPPR